MNMAAKLKRLRVSFETLPLWDCGDLPYTLTSDVLIPGSVLRPPPLAPQAPKNTGQPETQSGHCEDMHTACTRLPVRRVYIVHDAVPTRPAGPGKAHSHYTW